MSIQQMRVPIFLLAAVVGLALLFGGSGTAHADDPGGLHAEFDWSVPDRLLDESDFKCLNDQHITHDAASECPEVPRAIDVYYAPGEAKYSPQEINPAGGWPVILDACTLSTGPLVGYSWQLTVGLAPSGLVSPRPLGSGICLVEAHFPEEGIYDVTLTITDAQGNSDSITHEVVVQDFLIVSVGDSYSSGEGNPEGHFFINGGTPPLWRDYNEGCHRSGIAGSAQAALAIEQSNPKTSVTFIHVACTGATINQRGDDLDTGGLLTAYKTGVADSKLQDPQIEQIADLTGGREIDALAISIGGNDIGFGAIIEDCLIFADCHIKREDWFFYPLRDETAADIFDRNIPGLYTSC